jgi:ribosomal protein S20
MVFRAIALRSLRAIPSQPHPRSTIPLPRPRRIAYRPLSTTQRLLRPEPDPSETKPPPNDKKDKEKEKQAKNENAPPQSPWRVFIQTLKEEIEANKGWQENVKQLKGEVDKMADSAALKKGRDVYEKTRVSRETALSTEQSLIQPCLCNLEHFPALPVDYPLPILLYFCASPPHDSLICVYFHRAPPLGY